jgi:dihydrofolate reductase
VAATPASGSSVGKGGCTPSPGPWPSSSPPPDPGQRGRPGRRRHPDFGPIRGDWDPSWRGWWGEDTPYHGPVFVLTHHPRDPLTMQGGTTFTFITDGIHAALDQARTAAGDRDVAIAGGAATVNQYLAAGLIDELRTHIVPITLGAGERLFDGVPPLHLEILAVRAASLTTHISYRVLH